MKCYNCDSIITMQPKCPVCSIKIDAKDYELTSSKVILEQIKNIKDFARFIGLFYFKPTLLILLAIIAGAAAIYFFASGYRFVYMIGAFVAILAGNFANEMKKVERNYRDFQKGNNHYYILWPLKTEVRTFFCDANENLETKEVLRQRLHALEKRGKDTTFLRFNYTRLLHPHKPKLFMTKEIFFTKYFGKNNHYLKTNNYEDESYVAVEGAIHGFLVMDEKVVTVYNTPSLSKEYFDKLK